MNERLEGEALAALRERLVARADESDIVQIDAVIEELGELREQPSAESQMRERQAAIMRLTRSEALGRGDLEQALREITETAATVLGVQRCGVWRYNDDLSALIRIELYTATDDVHEHGVELQTSEYPLYFAALREAQIVATHDARTDPRTAEFRDDYLAPLGITSMLDAPLQVGGRMVGVICNEHVGPPRHWTAFDEQFAGALGDVVALAFESHERRRTSDELRSMVELAEQRLATIERQRLAIADLSTPIIDIWDKVLALPVIGLVDTQRSIQMTERLLARIAESGAESVIVDLTGVDAVDTMTASHLLQMARAASLLGAFPLLCGISPPIAQTLIQLEVDLTEVITVRSLAEALRICLRRRTHAATHGHA